MLYVYWNLLLFWGIIKIEGIRGSVLSVSRNFLGQRNCLTLKHFQCSPETAMQCKLHDEVEGASRVGAGAQKADHVWMVHLHHKRQNVWDCDKIHTEACLFLTVCHTITRLCGCYLFQASALSNKKMCEKKYKKKHQKNYDCHLFQASVLSYQVLKLSRTVLRLQHLHGNPLMADRKGFKCSKWIFF